MWDLIVALGSEPQPLHWEHGVFATGPSGKSFFFSLKWSWLRGKLFSSIHCLTHRLAYSGLNKTVNAWRNGRCGFQGGPNEQPRHRPLRTAAKWRPPIGCPSSIQSCCTEPTLCPPKPTTSHPAFIPRPWQAPGYRSSFQISEANKKQQQLWGTQFSKANCVQWLIYLSLSIFLFIPAEMCMSHSSCWRIFFF